MRNHLKSVHIDQTKEFKGIEILYKLSEGFSSFSQTVTVGNWMPWIGAAIESMVVMTGFSSQTIKAPLMKNPDAMNLRIKIMNLCK